MISYNDRHQTFLDEIRSGIKKFGTNAAARCDMSEDIDHDDLMAELESKFDELFGTSSDQCGYNSDIKREM